MPKRIAGLWQRLISFQNLLVAHGKARRGKRDRPDVSAFEFDLERNLLALHCELQERSYRPGTYRAFTIREPKAPLISAAPFRDRVVHHALMNALEPILNSRFNFDSYACRKGKGTHAALDRYTHYARSFRFVWHGDIRKYFPSIDHEVLKNILDRIVKDPEVLWLAAKIIDASNAQEEVQAWFPGDDLLTLATRRKGLPIGNLTSQWLANLYLDPYDRFVKQTLRVGGYVRYCDDFCLFADDRDVLNSWAERSAAFLLGLRLELNPKHLKVEPVSQGIAFLGMKVFPSHRRIASAKLARSIRHLKKRASMVGLRLNGQGRLDVALPWLAHAAHADTWSLRAKVLFRLP